jgi:hypothetical protein
MSKKDAIASYMQDSSSDEYASEGRPQPGAPPFKGLANAKLFYLCATFYRYGWNCYVVRLTKKTGRPEEEAGQPV